MNNSIYDIQKRCEYIKPIVVIKCATFNHEPYLHDALEGFVMQQTNFPFVAIVHDDASTDGTADIIREYAEKYPDIIHPIYETENQYSKHDGSLGRIMNAACEATGAKYYALCEGDDYWTDPLKLQKQVDFLESHPDYTMCFGNAIEHWEDGFSADHKYSDVYDINYTGETLFEPWIISTMSVMIRADVYNSEIYTKVCKLKNMPMRDVQLFLSAATIGKVRGMSDIFGIYRRTDSGASNALQNHYLHLNSLIKISKYFGKNYLDICRKKFRIFYFTSLKELIRSGKNFKFVLRYSLFAPKESILEIMHWTKIIIARKLKS